MQSVCFLCFWWLHPHRFCAIIWLLTNKLRNYLNFIIVFTFLVKHSGIVEINRIMLIVDLEICLMLNSECIYVNILLIRVYF